VPSVNASAVEELMVVAQKNQHLSVVEIKRVWVVLCISINWMRIQINCKFKQCQNERNGK